MVFRYININSGRSDRIYPPGRKFYHFYCFFKLTLHGFNHKIKQFLDTIIDRMVNIKIKAQQFEIIKEKVIELIID
jgi:hypothetical protein